MTIQAKDLVTALLALGLNRSDFYVRTEIYRRVKGSDGRYYPEYGGAIGFLKTPPPRMPEAQGVALVDRMVAAGLQANVIFYKGAVSHLSVRNDYGPGSRRVTYITPEMVAQALAAKEVN